MSIQNLEDNMRVLKDFSIRYLNELSAQVTAESGRASDQYHLGKLLLRCLKNAPDFLCHIDGATGKSETNASILKRSVECATSFRNLGLNVGDVVCIIAPNNLEVVAVLLASFYNGLAANAVDRKLAKDELTHAISIAEPKIIFCQTERLEDIKAVVNQIKVETKIVTFDGESDFNSFIKAHKKDIRVEDFRVTDFDPKDVIAYLTSTSGTTGVPKNAASTHYTAYAHLPYCLQWETKFPTPYPIQLVMSPLQWISTVMYIIISIVYRITRVQSSSDTTVEHVCHLMNKYRPNHTLCNPTFLLSLLRKSGEKCDFSCFDSIMVGGSSVTSEVVDELKRASPKTIIVHGYGMSEAGAVAILPYNGGESIPIKVIRLLQYQIVEPDTGKIVTDTGKPGELWLKGSSVFKGYYNNPEATAETFSEDGWLKTGDLFCMDENQHMYFIDRIKMLLKYKNNQISPIEIESVIRQHPGVQDAAVAGLPDLECGELPIAFVVKKKELDKKRLEHEIKELVNETLSESKRLYGGVRFVDTLPMTGTMKIDRKKLKAMAKELAVSS